MAKMRWPWEIIKISKHYIEQEVAWPLWPFGSPYVSVIITQKNVLYLLTFFPMANISLPWPDFSHGRAVFPWEKPVSHGKRGFCHGKVNFKCCLLAFIIRIGNQL